MSWIKDKSKEDIIELSKAIQDKEYMHYGIKLVWQNTVIIELLADIKEELKKR